MANHCKHRHNPTIFKPYPNYAIQGSGSKPYLFIRIFYSVHHSCYTTRGNTKCRDKPTLCNVITYTLNGNNPSPGTGLWTVTSGQTGITFSDATQPNAVASGLVPGQVYQFTWTITPTAPCPPQSGSV